MRILIIEDDKDLAQLTKLALEKENFTVDMCLDGAEGLYYMQENMYDLVLLDRMLPSMDGTQVLKEARQSNISTPVIFLTALGELQDKVNGLNCGAAVSYTHLVGSLMGKNELTDLLFPVLQEGAKGYASWKLFPEYPTLKHYVEVLLDSPEFFVMFWNSVKITAGALAGGLLVLSLIHI